MIKENLAYRSIKFIFKDIVFDILSWPVWWYTSGAVNAIKKMGRVISQGNQELSLSVWTKNLFTPMFGQYDWQGRIISFFMRFIQVCLRSIALFIWLLVCVVLFFVWLSLPVFVVIGFIMSFSK